MTNRQIYFDSSKNKLPENWTNINSTAYYNRTFWKRCKCEYGTNNPCKGLCDLFNPTLTEKSKWTNGCNESGEYYYKYEPNETTSCNTECAEQCIDECTNDCNCGCKKKTTNKVVSSYIVNDRCTECKDVSIIYRSPNEETDCDNIVELRIPKNGSKQKYLAKYFSPKFVYANRFQCATLPAYNDMPNNQVDNKRQYQFTEATQSALTNRGIKNSIIAKDLISKKKIINDKNGITIPMNVIGRSSYYYFGNFPINTGLVPQDISKTYFGN